MLQPNSKSIQIQTALYLGCAIVSALIHALDTYCDKVYSYNPLPSLSIQEQGGRWPDSPGSIQYCNSTLFSTMLLNYNQPTPWLHWPVNNWLVRYFSFKSNNCIRIAELTWVKQYVHVNTVLRSACGQRPGLICMTDRVIYYCGLCDLIDKSSRSKQYFSWYFNRKWSNVILCIHL